ncbi:MAG: fructose-bisphosphate aldolase class I [Legionellales bacterium]|nr:fructose-bisphosphate aldolase class I [Legionellales bacterium]
MSRLEKTMNALTRSGTGILAADESNKTIAKRLESIHLKSTPESRYAYRQLLLSTPNLSKYISGVILYDETIQQDGPNGPLRQLAKGYEIGIKVDLGLEDLPFCDHEKITKGLDDLGQRLTHYKSLGATFTKWRNVFRISDSTPSMTAVTANCEVLARYAAIAQQHDFIPIVEPEVLLDGNHSIEDCAATTSRVLNTLFNALSMHQVDLSLMILKPNMVVPGLSSGIPFDADLAAQWTISTFMNHVPAAVRSINFLSGGLSPENAYETLKKINEIGGWLPWRMSFSFARALQEPCLDSWGGKPENTAKAQAKLIEFAKKNCECLAEIADTESIAEPA